MESKELEARIRDIIKQPMRSEVSTADIAVGFWSSTALNEKVFDLAQLVTAEVERAKAELGALLLGEDAPEDLYPDDGNGDEDTWNAGRNTVNIEWRQHIRNKLGSRS